MSRRGNLDPTQMIQDSHAVDLALSAYEKEALEHMKSLQKAQHRVSNDVAPDTLRYLFTIFH